MCVNGATITHIIIVISNADQCKQFIRGHCQDPNWHWVALSQSLERISSFKANLNNIENSVDLFKSLGSSLYRLVLHESGKGNRKSNFDFNAISQFENLGWLEISNYAPMAVTNVPVLANFKQLESFDISGNELTNTQVIIQHMSFNITRLVKQC